MTTGNESQAEALRGALADATSAGENGTTTVEVGTATTTAVPDDGGSVPGLTGTTAVTVVALVCALLAALASGRRHGG